MSPLIRYSPIFEFPLLPLHCRSTTMHPDHMWLHSHLLHQMNLTYLMDTCLWFTCFISILSIPNVHPPVVWPIMNPHTTRSGTYLASLQIRLAVVRSSPGLGTFWLNPNLSIQVWSGGRPNCQPEPPKPGSIGLGSVQTFLNLLLKGKRKGEQLSLI